MDKKEEILKLKQILMEKIKSENDFRYNSLLFDEIINIIDESGNKSKYSLWIIREYLKGNIQRFEDIESRCKQALILFKNNLSKFDNSQKQLNKMSFQELEMLVEPYQDILTQNAVKRMNKEKIWSEIDVVYEGPEGKIYSPKTKEASIFLGQGTKWCTAAINRNIFDYYNEQGPLYVFVLPKKDEQGREIKYQLHIESSQFMDMEDMNANLKSVFGLVEKMPEHKKIHLSLKQIFFPLQIDIFPDFFEDLLYNHLSISASFSPSFCTDFEQKTRIINVLNNLPESKKINVLKANPYLFSYFQNLNDDLIISLLDNSFFVQQIEKPSLSVLLYILEKHPKRIQFISDKISDDIKIELIKQIGLWQKENKIDFSQSRVMLLDLFSAKSVRDSESEQIIIECLKILPDILLSLKKPTNEMIMAAIKKDGFAIRYVKEPTEEMKLDAIKQNPNVLEIIKNPTNEMIIDAISKKGELIQLIKIPSEKIALIALETCGEAIKYIKNASDEIKLKAIKNDGLSIRHIYNPTEEMKLEAVRQNGKAIKYIKKPSDLIKLEAVKQNSDVFLYTGFFTEEIQMEALKHDVKNFHRFFNPSNKVIYEAIKKDPFLIKNIHKATDKMKLLALKNNGLVIKYIENATNEMKLEACKSNGTAIQYIKNPSEEMKWEAIRQNNESIAFIRDITHDMYLESIKKRFISHNSMIQTEELKEKIFDLNPNYFCHINKPSFELLLKAVKHDGNNIRHSKNNLHSIDEMKILREEALKSNHRSVDYIEDLTEKEIKIFFESLSKSESTMRAGYIANRIKPKEIETVEYIIEKTKENKILNFYFKSYLENILKKTPKNDEEIIMKI